MYGDLIQLTGPKGKVSAKWQRVPLTTAGKRKKASIGEATLQSVLFRHADILPLAEIDPAYADAVPVCTELTTRAGSIDALYLTPTGRIVLAEFKLWRNPSARREVLGQILDYAGVLASWNYDDLERGVRQRTGRSPFDIVSTAHGGAREERFVDNVARSLRCGDFLLLIIGDGIREGVEDIVAYVQKHSGLRFNLALIEAAVYRRSRRKGVMIQPRVLAKTELMPREVLVPGESLRPPPDQPEPQRGPDEERSPVEDENERFWNAVLDGFAFDDPVPEVPRTSRWATVHVTVSGSGRNGWGLFFGARIDRFTSPASAKAYWAWRKDVPEAKRIFDSIVNVLDSDEEFGRRLGGYEEWTENGQPRLGFVLPLELKGNTVIRDFDRAVKWMRHHFNLLVSTLHPECRRRLRGKG